MKPSRSLYRPFFTPEECALLDASSPDDLMSEINLLRILLARTLAACQHVRQLSLELHGKVLSAFSHAGIVLARMARLQHQLHNPIDEIRAQIELGKEIGRRRMGVYDYFTARPADA